MTVTTLGLTLALLGALGWTLFDVARKSLTLRIAPPALTVWLPLAQVPVLLVWSASTGPCVLPRASLGPMALSIALNVVALLAFMQAMRLSPMSLTIPLLSFTPVGATLLGWWIGGQRPTGWQGLGILLVLTGAFTLGMRSGAWSGLRAYVRDPGVKRMALTAVIWSATAVIDQVALQRGAGYWYAPAITAGVGLLMGAWMLVRRQGALLMGGGRAMLAHPRIALLAVLIGTAALALQLESLRYAPVGFVETLKRGMGMTGAILFGWLVFDEPITSSKILAVLLLTAGVGLVTIGG